MSFGSRRAMVVAISIHQPTVEYATHVCRPAREFGHASHFFLKPMASKDEDEKTAQKAQPPRLDTKC